jgi:hypothetical protein
MGHAGKTKARHNGFASPLAGEDAISERRRTVVSAVAAAAAGIAYAAISWDGWVTNFQVRWMCGEDRGFVLASRRDVSTLGIPEEVASRDPGALETFGRRYPTIVAAGPGERAPYELAERWPTKVRDYWGFGVQRTELSVVARAEGNRVLATTSLYRRVDRGPARWQGLRNALVPPAEKCVASDRADFVVRALAPAAQ